jgi:hypothetical protein
VERLKLVGKAAQLLEASKKDQEKAEYTKEDLNKCICQLGDECAAAVLQSIKKIVESMSFVKTMVEKQLPQGVTVDMLSDVGILYFTQACADVPVLLEELEKPKEDL